MNREQFLNRLEILLQDISEEERVEALAFYRSYFEDAGENKEEDIIRELESPEKVAQSIKADLAGEGNTSEENRQSAYNQNQGQQTSNAYSNAYNQQEYINNVNQTIQNLQSVEKKKKNTTTIVLGIIVAVLTCPIWLTLLAVVAALIVAVAACLLAVLASVVAVVGGCIIAGFVVLGVGGGLLFSGSPAVGLAVIGIGLILIAIGLLAIVLLVWLCAVALPWICKGIVKLCKMPFQKRKKERLA